MLYLKILNEKFLKTKNAEKFFFKNIYLLCIQHSVCVYVCRPEESTRPYYRGL